MDGMSDGIRKLAVRRQKKSYTMMLFDGAGSPFVAVRSRIGVPYRDLPLQREADFPTMTPGGNVLLAGEEYVPDSVDDAALWTAAVAEVSWTGDRSMPSAFREDIGAARRWQYATVNTGSFDTPQRMATVLGNAGRIGWELVTVYDKSSNWFAGMEKGFMLLRREVPEGVEPESWSIQFRS
jgi:hypothetical protein